MPAASTVPGVSLAVPALWQPIDLDPSTGVDSARRYVDEAIPGARGAEARALMFGLLRRVIAEAIERGAVFAALYRSSSGAVPCSASLMVAVVETSFLPAAEPGLTPPDGAGCAD